MLANGRSFRGIVRDISAQGLCGFLICPDTEFAPPGAAVEVTATAGSRSVGPLKADLVASEPSFLSGYDLLFTCKFTGLDKTGLSVLNEFAEANKIDAEGESTEEPDAAGLSLPDIENADIVQFTFPARFSYVAHFRDACEKLAEEAGFEKYECHMIKIVADEIFSNALHHGSDVYGGSRIHARVVVGPGAIALCVRDHCGRPFDYRKYRISRDKATPGLGSGLSLVHRIVDDWSVKIEPGRFTEVCAFKRKASSARPAAVS